MSREFEISVLHPIACLPAKCCCRSFAWRCSLAPERYISLNHSAGQYPKVQHTSVRLIDRCISVFYLSEISLSSSFAAALGVLNSTPLANDINNAIVVAFVDTNNIIHWFGQMLRAARRLSKSVQRLRLRLTAGHGHERAERRSPPDFVVMATWGRTTRLVPLAFN